MSDDDFTRVPPGEFWRLVRAQGPTDDSPPRPPPTDPPEPPEPAPPPAEGSLEERLAAAQLQGLGPNLRRQLAFVGADEAVFELQVLGARRYPTDSFEKSRACHARGPDEAVRLCAEADGQLAHGVYLLPARLRPGVESRHSAPGRWYDVPKGTGTTDSDVEARLVLAVDFDVKRPSSISATDEEVARSVRVALNAWSFLTHHLGESSLAYLHSGNGRQIHIALDAVPVNEESKCAAAGLLVGLAHLFNTPEVSVDEKLFDPKRILPACGTLKKKGAPGVPERPHRRTAIVAPESPTRVSLDQLMGLARAVWGACDEAGRNAMNKVFGYKPQQPTQVPSGSVVERAPENPDAPFTRANAVDPQQVAEWLGLYNARGEVECPGCGETRGVAVINHGFKCSHNRCKDRGRSGFRTNIDLVMEVQRVEAREALFAISERFDLGLHPRVQESATQDPQRLAAAEAAAQQVYAQADVDEWLKPLGDHLKNSVARAVRRRVGIEYPVPLPWDELKEHFGGGLWPGLHVLCSGTGVGKTAAVLQICKHAAEKKVPVAYVGLEMDDLQFDLRLVGEEARMRWSEMYTGQTDMESLGRATQVALDLAAKGLPLHAVNRNPMGWPASKLHALAAALRQKYPEPPWSEDGKSGGPGSRPILIVLDYLQIIGPEEGEDGKYKTLDLRERIGRAAYALREVATAHNISILVVASVARDKYGLWPMIMNAEMAWEHDEHHRIINRRVTIPDVLVGLGKESGEIEYGADSVSVLARVPETYVEGHGESVVFATAKGRATGARWTPMHFTGFRYEAARDGGGAVIEALTKSTRAKEQKKVQKEEDKKQTEVEVAQRRTAAADAKEQQRARDRDACLHVVTQYPGIGSRQLRASMAAVLGGCGKDRADEAISYCESVSHTITVDRSNGKNLRHYPSGYDHSQLHPDPNRPQTESDVCDAPSKKSPIPPMCGATRATPGGEDEIPSATPATPATRGPSSGDHNIEGVAEVSATPPRPPATPSTPSQNVADAQAEADSSELFELDDAGWRARAKERGWSEPRTRRALALARVRLKRARTDAVDLGRAADAGDDPRATATEWGWDDQRIRDAMRFVTDGSAVANGSEKERKVVNGGEVERTASEDPANEVASADRQAESDADVISCMPRDERDAHVKDWPEDRRARATATLKAREPGITKDAKALQRESYRGTDIEAWAKERGWSESRFRAAKIRMTW